jgi:hypothetical protein
MLAKDKKVVTLVFEENVRLKVLSNGKEEGV